MCISRWIVSRLDGLAWFDWLVGWLMHPHHGRGADHVIVIVIVITTIIITTIIIILIITTITTIR